MFFRKFEPEFGAFRGSVARARLPEAGEHQLELWAVDAAQMRVRRLAQTVVVRGEEASVERREGPP